jgi:methyl-accepting chemotaxis protein
MKSLSIFQRLMVTATIFLALLGSIVVFSIFQVRAVSESLERVNSVNSVKQRYAINFRGSVHDRAIAMRDVTLIADEPALEKRLADIDRLAAAYADSAKKMDDLFQARADTVSDDEKSLLADIKAVEARAQPMMSKVIATRRQGQLHEAQKLVLDEAAQPFADWLKAINRLIDHEESLNKAESAVVATIVGRFGWLMLTALSILGVLIMAVMAQTGRGLQKVLGGEPADVAAVANRVALGDLSSAIVLRAGDTSSLFATVAKMQQSLKERADQDRARAENERERVATELAAAAENMRIRIALDRVSAGVMLAGPDGKIIYANDFGTNIFRLRAADIRKQLPQFDAERIVGTTFDSLHGVPSLAGLTTTHSADIQIGATTLRVIANPVVDNAGQRLGTVVQWIDRTEEIAIEEEVQQTVSEAVEGNLTVRIREEGKEGFIKTLADGVNRLIGSIAEVMRTITHAASEVGTGAEEISRGNADLSSRTEQQASSLEETAASMEQMTAAVKNNADNAAQANQLARAARDQAEQGGAVVQSAVLAMSEINASSKKIGDIIGVIDDIAFQTNLLALNAAVEAARAGEQGRGFAVVASEVRNLASRSAAAAKEIKGLIQESVAKVEDGTKLVDASGKVLQDIVSGVKKVTDVVAEIAASSQEQASGIEQVNKAVMSMDEGTQQNAALVEQATAAAQSLNVQAGNLTQMMSRFQIGSESARTPAARATPAKSLSRAAPERRGPNRAFAKAAAKPAATSVSAQASAASGGGNSDWQEF